MHTITTTTGARHPRGVALLSIVAACAIFIIPELTQSLEYTRTSIGNGEIWRIFTCHWTHWTAEHLFWDLAAFVLLLVACLRINVRKTLLTLATAIVAIPSGIWLLFPQMTHYRGLSGIDTALFSFFIIQTLKSLRLNSSRLELILMYSLTAGFILKLSYELFTGHTVFVGNMGRNVIAVPLAHVIGAAAGCLPWILCRTADSNSA